VKQLLQRELLTVPGDTPYFIIPYLWPPNSPDL